MVLATVLNFFSTYLIEVMAGLLVIGLFFRMASYRSSKKEDVFFSSFVSEVEKILLLQKEEESPKIDDVDAYLANLLESVKDKLPRRSLRNRSHKNANSEKAQKLGAQNVVSIRDYIQGDQGLFLGVKAESSSFKSKFPPNFNDLSDRILEHDPHWNYLLGIFPIAPISRLIDVLPGLFVVFGIFGTFIGISMALPEIAKIDFNNLDASGDILTSFVLNVTYAMKTSIAGILFSLILTLMNTLAPVRGQRDKTYKKVTNCFENIWLSIHGEKTIEQEMHEVLPELLKEMKQMNENLASVLNQNDKDNKESA